MLCCNVCISSLAVQVQLPEMEGQALRQLMHSIQGLPQHAKSVAGNIQKVGWYVVTACSQLLAPVSIVEADLHCKRRS